MLCPLDEPGLPMPDSYPEDSNREINRYTLLGEYDATYVALLRQRMTDDASTFGADSGGHDIDSQFSGAHEPRLYCCSRPV